MSLIVSRIAHENSRVATRVNAVSSNNETRASVKIRYTICADVIRFIVTSGNKRCLLGTITMTANLRLYYRAAASRGGPAEKVLQDAADSRRVLGRLQELPMNTCLTNAAVTPVPMQPDAPLPLRKLQAVAYRSSSTSELGCSLPCASDSTRHLKKNKKYI